MPTAHPDPDPTDVAPDHLNAQLHAERSAVAAYTAAIACTGTLHSELFDARLSHIQRIDLLSRHIWALGGLPAEGSPPTGPFRDAEERLKRARDDHAVSAILAAAERATLEALDTRTERLPDRSRRVVEREVLPRQRTCWRRLADLRRRLAGDRED